jgi:uracil-DNA glycosylase
MKPIFLIGEAFGDYEARLNLPFVGPSGAELLRMMNESGLISLTSSDHLHLSAWYSRHDPRSIDRIWRAHPEVYRTNVFNIHPPRNSLEFFCGPKNVSLPGYPPLIKSKFVREDFRHELSRLTDEILTHDPNLIIPLGNTPLWCLSGQTGISKIRGTTLLSTHTVLDYKLLPTFHPAAIIREWSNRSTVIADLMKAKRESTYADIRRPHREIIIEPSLTDIAEFFAQHCPNCGLLSVDIETTGTRITCIGFAPSSQIALVVPFDDPRTKNRSYWPTQNDERACWGLIRKVLENEKIPKLFQNGTYDIGFLWRAYGIRTYGAAEDTMLLHHALHPEMRKSLGLLGSIYSDEGAWKFMRKKHETIKRDN